MGASEQSSLRWRPYDHHDPDGGIIRLLPYLPAVRWPASLQFEGEWDGLALFAAEEILDHWGEEANQEAASPGATAVAVSIAVGGEERWMLSSLESLPDIEAPVYPDPEPVAALEMAEEEEKPVWLLEPGLDDDAWAELVGDIVGESVRLSRLIRAAFGAVGARRRFLGAARRIALSEMRLSEAAAENRDVQIVMAAALVSARWERGRPMAPDHPIAVRGDNRFAARLRGALASLRESWIGEQIDDEASPESVLLAPVVQPWFPHILERLERDPTPERVEPYGGEKGRWHASR